MKRIRLGVGTDGNPIYLTPELRQHTHTHVIGSSGRGKSKFLEWLIRQDLDAGHGLCLIDWHGTLYNDVLRYCGLLSVGLPIGSVSDSREIILLNPSQPDFITGFNPFMNPGDDVSTQVSRRINATIRPWGVSNTNEMPTFERITRLLYTFMAETGQTLPNAAALLDPARRDLREYATEVTDDNYIKGQWQRLQGIKNLREWEDKVLSTENRLSRFIGSKGVRRFMGLTEGNIDLTDVMDKGKILLVNLGPSGFLDREAARVFASLLVYEFMHTAMLRANRSQMGEKPEHYILYLDEFQEYITDDIAAMLEQVRKGGLHMVLAHQHLAQLINDGNERLKDSIFTNCRVKAVFGGLPYKSAEELGNEMFLPDLNARQIKVTNTHTIHLYDEETRVQKSRASGAGQSEGKSWADTRGASTTRGSSSGSGSDHGHGSSSGISVTTGITIPEGAVEGVRTNSDSSSRTVSDSYSDSSFSSESESQSAMHSHTEGGSKARSTFQTQGETVVPFLKPRAVQENLPDVEWSLEEKRARCAEMIINQPQRYYFLKLDTEPTQPMTVEAVEDYGLPERSLLEYQQDVYRVQGALPANDVDRLLGESYQKFLAVAAASAVKSIPTDDESSGDSKVASPREIRMQQPQIGGWNRVALAKEVSVGKPAIAIKSGTRQRGPKANVEEYARLAGIVTAAGNRWKEPEELLKISERLDKENIPPPKEWLKRVPPARTWKRQFENDSHVLSEVLIYRCGVAGYPLR